MHSRVLIGCIVLPTRTAHTITDLRAFASLSCTSLQLNYTGCCLECVYLFDPHGGTLFHPPANHQSSQQQGGGATRYIFISHRSTTDDMVQANRIERNTPRDDQLITSNCLTLKETNNDTLLGCFKFPLHRQRKIRGTRLSHCHF